MIDIATTYTPFRLKLSRKSPVQLTIALQNKSGENKMVSMELRLSRHLSLDKSGFRNTDTKKFESFGKGEKKQLYYEIWPKHLADSGEQPVKIVVSEHYNNFGYIAKEYSKSIPLTIEE